MNEIRNKYLNILILPTDYCNMNCIYCFNSRVTDHTNVMGMDILKQIYDITLPYYEEVSFLWHGGEPLSAGIEFYEKAYDLQDKHKGFRCRITNSMQTNLTLMDEKFATFFVKHDTHIGSSYDGSTNDKTRQKSDLILKGYETYKNAGGEAGFIYVVQSNNIDTLIDDYEWFKSHNINYTISRYRTKNRDDDSLYVSSEYYARKICDFFDYWFTDLNCSIHISYFEMFVSYILYRRKSLCSYNSCLGKRVGIYPNGDIYNCNRDFPKEYYFGNVFDYTDIHECFNSEGFQKLLDDAYCRREKCRNDCDIYDFCVGGCNSDALMAGAVKFCNKDICAGLKMVFSHVYDIIIMWINKSDDDIKENLNPYLQKCIITYKHVNDMKQEGSSDV